MMAETPSFPSRADPLLVAPRILVVDDQDANRTMVARRMERAGYTAETAAGGAEALLMVKARVPALVLLDLMMPEMDGMETLRRLRLAHDASHLPVIMLTAADEAANVVRALAAGANDYVAKPFEIGVLLSRVRTQLDRRAAVVALDEANQMLEARVRQRTAEVEAANEQLRRELMRAQLLEQELRAAAIRAEAGSRSKTIFLANMTHELKTPLNGIIGYAELLLQMGIESPASGEIEDYLGTIVESGQHLSRLLDDVLTLARLDGGPLEVLERQTTARILVQDALLMLRERLHERRVKVELAGDLDQSVSVDPRLMRQVLAALIGNAVKFSKADETVRVTAETRHEGLAITVEDQGIGMSAAEIEKVFQPFWQGEQSLARRFQGLGVGLTIARDILQAHAGALTLVSRPGGGTIATAILPSERVLGHRHVA